MINRSRITVLVSLVIAGVALGISVQAGAARRAMMEPTIVATVDINRVREGLSERVDAQAGLVAKAQQIEAENTERISKIEEIQAELADVVDPARREELQDDLDMHLVRAAAWREYIKQQLDIEKSLLLQDLYRKITEAVTEVAELEGIGLVLINDSNLTVQTISDSKVARELQVRQQISSRRIIYAAPTIDITEQLVVRMNNAYASAQGGR
ncbi:MAG: OmpH family outer membrane protein [Phycisphaerales bacterium]|nr:OmpH family outer membrane protein [Phycisphaerales bacterium]